MSALAACRLICDPPQNGAWNMAVDEALLEQLPASQTPVLRFYQWDEPTLSLGYFQKYEERALHPPSTTVACVRRLSGGGAILHDRELTYSLLLPGTHPLARDTESLYFTVHRALIAVLKELLGFGPGDFPLDIRQADTTDIPPPFLCFERRARGDVIVRSSAQAPAAHKVVGSAQRRRRGMVLQHGSILLDRASAAPELPGINNLQQRFLHAERLQESLPEHLVGPLKLSFSRSLLTPEESDAAERFRHEKYVSPAWIRKK